MQITFWECQKDQDTPEWMFQLFRKFDAFCTLLLMPFVWSKLCDFVHYNVKYVTFIVAYGTQQLQFDM
jgi:hypothetical protein